MHLYKSFERVSSLPEKNQTYKTEKILYEAGRIEIVEIKLQATGKMATLRTAKESLSSSTWSQGVKKKISENL